MTTVFDAAGEGSAKACWVLMPRAKADRFESASSPRNLRRFSQLPVTAPKNRTRIGPHHRRRKMNLFSPKTGYVRRSELGRRLYSERRITLRDRCHDAIQIDEDI